MKKIYFILAFCTAFSVMNAQQKTLTIDNQTPGWLSSKINYGDQLTVENLTVTGYINATDLKFIGTMLSNYALRKRIDLSNVNIISDTPEQNNVLFENIFDIQTSTPAYGDTLKYLSLPISAVSSYKCTSDCIFIDTLVVGGEKMSKIKKDFLCSNIYNIIFREGVDSVLEDARTGIKSLRSVSFPSTMKYIGKKAFYNCKNLTNIILPESIEEICDQAFYGCAYSPDTLILPDSLKSYHTRAIEGAKVIYFPSNIKDIKNSYTKYNNSTNIYTNYDYIRSYMEFHIAAVTPPKFSCYYEGCLSESMVYVPKSSLDLYKNASVWGKSTILAEPNPATSIDIDLDSVELIKGKTAQLSAIVLPIDADSTNYIWTTSNSEIVTVSSTGIVTANMSGEAYIYSTLVANNNIMDSCKVKVVQPIIEIELSEHNIEIKKGDSKQIYPEIFPSDADNKVLLWSSTDSLIARVNKDGLVEGLKSGNVYIKVNSSDNPKIIDSCYVKVVQPVEGISINYPNYTFNSIGESIQLEVTLFPEDASNTNLRWFCSNEVVCKVSERGCVVALSEGTAVIIVTTEDGGYTDVCLVTVNLSSAINEFSNSNIKITTENNLLRVHNKPIEEMLSIYNIDGKLIYKGTGDYHYLNNGIYIVIVGNVWKKVTITD